MALNIRLDFGDCYPITTLKEDLTLSTFDTILQNGQIVPMGINISDKAHPLLPNVYNLGFGPLNKDNKIDDKVKLNHQDHSKLFSTIVFTALTFLRKNNEKYLGIDGSNNARAYLYYRCIQRNYDYLNKHINMYGVNYFVRILRKTNEQDDGHPLDEENILAQPNIIQKEASPKYDKLYNYFIFNLK